MSDTPLNQDALKWLTYIEDAIKDAGYNCNCATTPDNVSIDKDWLDYHLRELKKALLAVTQPELQANSKPKQNFEVVTSVEELDQLPMHSYVQGNDGFKHAKDWNGGWHLIVNRPSSAPHLSGSIELPARVLYRPEVNDA